MSDWISVEKKVIKREKKTLFRMSREEILSFLPGFFADYSTFVVSAAVYGSVLSPSFSETSDIDVMVFVKTNVSVEDFKEMKQEICRQTGRKVDFVAMQIRKKPQKALFADNVFYEQVWGFGRAIFGENFTDFENISSKIGKF